MNIKPNPVIDFSGSFIGSGTATVTLYLANPPQVRTEFVSVSEIIADNGNHWRKILTILAKLNCGDEPWKSYRDNKLLKLGEMICFEPSLQQSEGGKGDKERWHLVAGKASWQRLGFDCQQFTPLDDEGRAFYRGRVILTPYPDYRQFPNQLIEQVVDLMRLCA